MADKPPESRPEPTPAPKPRKANPQPESPVYGGQWGRSGKQKPPEESNTESPTPVGRPGRG